MRATKVCGAVSMVLAAAACGGATGTKVEAPAATKRVTAQGGSCKATSAAEPMTKTEQSATLALAKVAGRRVAFVADEDAKAIVTIDVDTRAELAQTRLDATPAQVWIAADGRLFVSLRDENELAVFSVVRADAPLTKLCAAPTPPEPIAIAPVPGESSVVVTTGWGHKLAVFDAATLAPKFDAKLPREPRSVVVADDGKTAFVSHAVGSLVSAIDLAGDKHDVTGVAMAGFEPHELLAIKEADETLAKLRKSSPTQALQMEEGFAAQRKRLARGRTSCQGFALAKSTAAPGRIFAPQVMVDPGDFEQRPDGYGSESQPTETPAVAVIDEGARAAMVSSITLGRDPMSMRRSAQRSARDEKAECLLPRAATIDAKTKSLLVTCYGIDAVIAYDATAANPLLAERRRWTVGSGPSGVAVDPDKHRAVVWSQFDRTITTFPIGGTELADEKLAPAAIQKTALAPLAEKLPAEYALGRILFHAAGDARIASDGRACASCHPDGRDDAITWATPEGPRRSIMLAGRAATSAPYSWNGNETTLHNHLGNTFDRLSGRGLRSIELDALVTYISRMPAPPPDAPTDNADKAKVDRGKAIFASREAGCSSCHAGSTFTDGKNHDVGSKHRADRESAFNTPSLHLVGGAGPYFHDGRYATLGELLEKTDGQMGHTKHLARPDLEALEAYLRTL